MKQAKQCVLLREHMKGRADRGLGKQSRARPTKSTRSDLSMQRSQSDQLVGHRYTPPTNDSSSSLNRRPQSFSPPSHPGLPSPAHSFNQSPHDLQRVIRLFNSRKFYCEGYLWRLDKKGNLFTRWFAQVTGCVISLWNAQEIEQASKEGKTVQPSSLNIIDSHVCVVHGMRNPQPPSPFLFALNNAGNNSHVFAVDSEYDLRRWINILRLAEWERARLSLMYTMTRIGLRMEKNQQLIYHMKHAGRHEGTLEARLPGDTDWRKLHVVLTDPNSPNLHKAKRRQSILGIPLGSKDGSSLLEGPNAQPSLAFFNSRKSKRPFLIMSNIYFAAAMWPENEKLVETSRTFKIEGTCIWQEGEGGDDILYKENRDGGRGAQQGQVLLMLETASVAGLDIAAELLGWIIAIWDCFKLHSRPTRFNLEPRDRLSPYLAYPIGPARDRLWFDPELIEGLNIGEDRPAAIKAGFEKVIIDRMRGAAGPPPLVGHPNGRPQSMHITNPSSSKGPPVLPPIGEVSRSNSSARSHSGDDPQPGFPAASAGPQPPVLTEADEENLIVESPQRSPSPEPQPILPLRPNGRSSAVSTPPPQSIKSSDIKQSTSNSSVASIVEPVKQPWKIQTDMHPHHNIRQDTMASSRYSESDYSNPVTGMDSAVPISPVALRQRLSQQIERSELARNSRAMSPPDTIQERVDSSPSIRHESPPPKSPKSPQRTNRISMPSDGGHADYIAAIQFMARSNSPDAIPMAEKRAQETERQSIHAQIQPPVPVIEEPTSPDPYGTADMLHAMQTYANTPPQQNQATFAPGKRQPSPAQSIPSPGHQRTPGRGVPTKTTSRKLASWSSDEDDDDDAKEEGNKPAKFAEAARINNRLLPPTPPSTQPSTQPSSSKSFESDRQSLRQSQGYRMSTQHPHPQPPFNPQYPPFAPQPQWGPPPSVMGMPPSGSMMGLDQYGHPHPDDPRMRQLPPGGLLELGLQGRYDKSAARMEEIAKETGGPLVQLPAKPREQDHGLVAAVASHQKERQREGGIGAALTERERERRLAEGRHRDMEIQPQHYAPGFGAPGMMPFNPMMQPFPQPQGPMTPQMMQQQQMAMYAAQQAFYNTMMAFGQQPMPGAGGPMSYMAPQPGYAQSAFGPPPSQPPQIPHPQQQPRRRSHDE